MTLAPDETRTDRPYPPSGRAASSATSIRSRRNI